MTSPNGHGYARVKTRAVTRPPSQVLKIGLIGSRVRASIMPSCPNIYEGRKDLILRVARRLRRLLPEESSPPSPRHWEGFTSCPGFPGLFRRPATPLPSPFLFQPLNFIVIRKGIQNQKGRGIIFIFRQSTLFLIPSRFGGNTPSISHTESIRNLGLGENFKDQNVLKKLYF